MTRVEWFKVRRLLILLLGIAYLLKFAIVLTYFTDQVKIEGLLFVLCNLYVSFAFVVAIKCSPRIIFAALIYVTYYVVYVTKAVVHYASGLNTTLSVLTINSYITDAIFVKALLFITIGHVLVVALLILIDRIPRLDGISYHRFNRSSPFLERILLFLSTVWIVVSSVVMYSLGVAVTGGDAVDLPYKLTGILFYSRTIIIPMLLLYFVQIAWVRGDAKAALRCYQILVLLAVSEIIVRASKSPFFVLLIQLCVLYGVTRFGGVRIRLPIKPLHLLLGIALAIVTLPAIEVYRALIVGGAENVGLAADFVDYVNTSDHGYILFFLDRIFQRMLGFLQFAGLLGDIGFNHDFWEVLQYGGIGKYYTHYYLGYTMEGHLSSPSLLGASLIVGGFNNWWVILLSYVAGMATIWSMLGRLPKMGVVVLSFLGFEIINTIMAGTIDFSLERIFLMSLSALMLETVFSFLNTFRRGKCVSI